MAILDQPGRRREAGRGDGFREWPGERERVMSWDSGGREEGGG